ncbi:MAG: hypothetical protein IT371_28600 [Deltaproteobacteria bacterium]|nr:hypothetical protein [Deltaproteobacteria bacterium]
MKLVGAGLLALGLACGRPALPEAELPPATGLRIRVRNDAASPIYLDGNARWLFSVTDAAGGPLMIDHPDLSGCDRCRTICELGRTVSDSGIGFVELAPGASVVEEWPAEVFTRGACACGHPCVSAASLAPGRYGLRVRYARDLPKEIYGRPARFDRFSFHDRTYRTSEQWGSCESYLDRTLERPFDFTGPGIVELVFR